MLNVNIIYRLEKAYEAELFHARETNDALAFAELERALLDFYKACGYSEDKAKDMREDVLFNVICRLYEDQT